MQALIVAPDAAVRRDLAHALACRGHDARPCADAEAALAALHEGAFPLVLMDHDPPALDAFDLCRRLRALPGGDRPVLLVLAADPAIDALAALAAAGADDYLPAPLDPVLLDLRLAAAERHAARPGAIPSATAEPDFSALVEHAPVVTYVAGTDEPGRPCYVSPRIETLIGYTAAEWLAEPGLWPARLHPDDRERVLAEWRWSNDTGEPFRVEYRLRHRDGRVVWVRDEASVLPDGDGAGRRRQGVVLDITERREAEAALRRSDARFRSLVRNALDVVAILDAEGIVRYVSPAIERVLGYVPADRIGASTFALVHPEDEARVRGLFARVLRRPGANGTATLRYRHADGSWRWLEVIGTNLLDDPSVGGIVLNYRDVTAARRAEEALRASEERLRLALENAAMGTWDWDLAIGWSVWSEHMAALYGLPAGTAGIAADAFAALVHPDDRDHLRAARDRLHAGDGDYAAEFRVVWPDGTVRWLESKGRATARDEAGRPTQVLGVTMDVTDRKEAEAALRESERQARVLSDAAHRQARELGLLDEVRTALARELDLPLLFRTVVEATARTFGYTMVSLYLIEERRLHLQHQVGYHRVLDRIPVSQGVMGRVARTGRPALVEDGRADPDFLSAFDGIVSEVCVPLHDEGRVVGVLNLETTDGVRLGDADLRLMLALSEHFDIAIGRARIYAAAQASEARFRGAFDHAPIGMALVDLDGRWLRVNRALTAMLGYTEAELLATTFQAVTLPDDIAADLEQVRLLLAGEADAYAIEKRYVHKDGRPVWVQLSVALLRDEDGAPGSFIAQIEDITERRSFEARLHHLALHDPLTGLPNRLLFAERLEQALAAELPRGRSTAVLFVDLDRFKLVNDGLGHEAGDQLLVAVARRLAAGLRPSDTVARLGGDEFAVLLASTTPADASKVAERIIEALRPPFALDGRDTYVGASVGVALGRPPRAHPDDLLRNADIALYRAKAAGRGTHARFEPSMTPAVLSRLDQETALRRAVERDELRLHYQPVVDLATGRVVGLESLVRWDHPGLGLLPPAEFIQLAEETGVIVPLGRWALAEACHQARAWCDCLPAAPVVGVNLSARQFRRPALVAEVAAALAASGLDPGCLELEITESVAMDHDAEVPRALAALRQLGVRLAIDDFGTGYSSLGYLRRLAVDALKIDRGFVAELDADAGGLAIVRAITTLAHDLGMTVTAEGIETPAQFVRLRELGVDRGQGYLFARPLPAETIDALLRDAPAPADPFAALLVAPPPGDPRRLPAATPGDAPSPSPPAEPRYPALGACLQHPA